MRSRRFALCLAALSTAWVVGCSGRVSPAIAPGESRQAAKVDTAPGVPSVAPTSEKATLPASAAQPPTLPSTVAPRDLKELIRLIQPSVVSIEASGTAGLAVGSGFVISDKGHVLTNFHVVGDSTALRVKTNDGHTHQAVMVAGDRAQDLALIRVESLSGAVTPLQLATTTPIEQGDEVVAFGSPLGYEGTVTTGIVSAVQRTIDVGQIRFGNLIQTSAPISPGNSGGPLVDRRSGHVIGINTLVANPQIASNIGFAIASPDVRDFLAAFLR